jgi:pimeloyl-ACP methyl ester carboxylesterase
MVGHSFGGVVITQAAEERPAKVALLVYLAAALLRNGKTGVLPGCPSAGAAPQLAPILAS